MPKSLALLVLVAACETSPSSQPDGGLSVDNSPQCQAAATHSDLAWIQSNVFTPSCVFGGCHSSVSGAGDGLVLESGESRGNLVDRKSMEDPPMMLVAPGDPTQSYLLVALGGEPGPLPQAGMMPAAQEPLCAQKVMAVERWIAAGAQP